MVEVFRSVFQPRNDLSWCTEAFVAASLRSHGAATTEWALDVRAHSTPGGQSNPALRGGLTLAVLLWKREL